jgi:predicted nucleotidyltransferase
MNEQDIIQKVIAIIQKHLSRGAYSFSLFGSHARGDNYAGSDIDIGILGKNPVPYEIMTRIIEEKDELLTLRKIDIVDLQSVDAPFRENVLSYAKRI